MRVTLQTIAERCGLTKQTVGEILNRKGKAYNADTIERVFSAAKDLGYRPHGMARAMVKGRLNTVALVLGEVNRSHLPQELLHSIHAGLATHGQRLLVSVLSDTQLRDPEFMPDVLGQLLVDGLLINYHYGFPPHLAQFISNHHIPATWINVRQDHDCVHFDEAAAARELTQRFIKLGHRRIAFIDTRSTQNPQHHHHSQVDHREGYRLAMLAAGLEPLFEPSFPNDDFTVDAALKKWYNQGISAGICGYLRLAHELALAARGQSLVLGKDFSLASFGNDGGQPRLATMTTSWQDLGRTAVDILMKRISSGSPQPSFAIPGTFFAHSSLGPLR